MYESISRSLMKTLSWRLIFVIISTITGVLLNQPISLSLSIAIISNIIGFFFYYLHERIWNRIHWGKKI